MVLLHEPVKVVHEPVSGIFGVLVMDPNMDGLDGTHLLAHSAEDAPELIDLVNDGVPVTLVILPAYQADTVGGTDRGAESAGHTLGPPIGVDIHPMGPPPTRRKGGPLLRILESDLVGVHKMLEGQGHTLEGGSEIRRPDCLWASYDLYGWWHLYLFFLEFNLRRGP